MVGSLFLCQNIAMKNIFNLYLSIDEKDILWEIMRLEEEDAISNNAELRKLSTNATAISGQIGTIAESISANC
jgi:hypothetical protein